MHTIPSLITQLEAAGLIEVKFKRKPRTGVHAFFNPKSGEMFYTHTTGYVRRMIEVRPFWASLDYTMKRYAPINKNIDQPMQTVCAMTNKLINWHKKVSLMIPTEIERLAYLLAYMQRRHTRATKTKKLA